MSLDRMSEPVRGVQTGGYAALPPTSTTPTTPASLKRQLELFQQELELMEQEIQAAGRQQEAGVASSSEVSALKREALRLKRQIAILEGQIDSAHSQDGEEEGEVAVQARISAGTVNDYRVLVTQVNNLIQKEADQRLSARILKYNNVLCLPHVAILAVLPRA
jgi:predicted  nucleic acid-binding Zn-ribbon protein